MDCDSGIDDLNCIQLRFTVDVPMGAEHNTYSIEKFSFQNNTYFEGHPFPSLEIGMHFIPILALIPFPKWRIPTLLSSTMSNTIAQSSSQILVNRTFK
jgi:hypothetical protein